MQFTIFTQLRLRLIEITVGYTKFEYTGQTKLNQFGHFDELNDF